MRYEAHIRFEDSGELYRALGVEAGRDIPRTEVRVRREGKEVELTIIAEDTHALRAALNSYLRWIELARNVMEVIEDGGT